MSMEDLCEILIVRQLISRESLIDILKKMIKLVDNQMTSRVAVDIGYGNGDLNALAHEVAEAMSPKSLVPQTTRDHLVSTFTDSLSLKTGISAKMIFHALMRTLSQEAGGGGATSFDLNEVKVPIAVEAVLDSVEFKKIEESMATDFIETYDDSRNRNIEAQLLLLEKLTEESKRTEADKLALEDGMQSLYRELHTIKGSSRFISAELTEKLVHAAEDLLGVIQKFYAQVPREDFKQVIALLLKVSDITWKLRDCIANEQSEALFWSESKSQQQYKDLVAQIQSLHKTLEERNYKVDITDVESIF